MLKPRAYIKKALKAYQTIDGASALRDAIIDILKEAYEQKIPKYTGDSLVDKKVLCGNAYNGFFDEIETEEYDKVVALSKEQLPFHIHDQYMFESARKLFKQRLEEA